MAAERQIVIRDGVVRRPAMPWSATVQSLLSHLHGLGLPVPEPLGFDDRFEFVSFLPGDAGEDVWPHQLGLAGVRSAGALLRAVHDGSRTWTADVDAVWAPTTAPAGLGPVICHGDPKPGNMVWRDGRAIGLFDWDAARPADPMDDVAYALDYLVPVNADATQLQCRGFSSVPDRRARAEALLAGYGWTSDVDVVDVAMARHEEAIDEVVCWGQAGYEPAATWVAEGWPRTWRSQLQELGQFSQF